MPRSALPASASATSFSRFGGSAARCFLEGVAPDGSGSASAAGRLAAAEPT